MIADAPARRTRVAGVGGGVDRLEISRDLLALAARDEAQAVTDQMDDARLHPRLGEHRLDRLREPFEPVDAGDQDVLDSALFEVGQDLQPELGALVFLEPHPEYVAPPVDVDTEREVARAALNAAALADLEH
jgi:hypothetical protein